MRPFRKILLATDFSKSANFALKRAAQLARQYKASLTTLHVFPEHLIDTASTWLSNTKNREFLQFKQEARKAFNAKIKPGLKTLKTNFVVEMGREDEAIIQHGKSKKCDLLTIGAHGHYYLHEYLLGTTAASVVKNAPCPVLVVKRKPDFRYNKILVPVDFSATSRKALAFAGKHFPDASIVLLHVQDTWYDRSAYRPYMKKRREGILRQQVHKIVKTKMEKFIKESKVDRSRITLAVRGGYPASVIAEEVKKKHINLVVIGTRGQTKLHYLLIGSMAEKILQEVSTDIIAVPPN